MNKRVCLRIDGVNHHLSKYKDYYGGGKNNMICPHCSLFNTHYSRCWDARGTPICSALAWANNWDDDFSVYFKTIKRK